MDNTKIDILDTDRFEKIVDQYQKSLINFHYRFVGNRQDAEDLAQETFLKVYLKLDTLKEGQKLRSWIFSIARNQAIDFFRKHKDREVALESEVLEYFAEYASNSSDDHEGNILNKQVAKELNTYLRELSDEDRRIIKLLYYEGLTYKEISKMMNINQNTLKSRLHRVRKVLLRAIRGNKVLKNVITAQ